MLWSMLSKVADQEGKDKTTSVIW